MRGRTPSTLDGAGGAAGLGGREAATSAKLGGGAASVAGSLRQSGAGSTAIVGIAGDAAGTIGIACPADARGRRFGGTTAAPGTSVGATAAAGWLRERTIGWPLSV